MRSEFKLAILYTQPLIYISQSLTRITLLSFTPSPTTYNSLTSQWFLFAVLTLCILSGGAILLLIATRCIGRPRFLLLLLLAAGLFGKSPIHMPEIPRWINDISYQGFELFCFYEGKSAIRSTSHACPVLSHAGYSRR